MSRVGSLWSFAATLVSSLALLSHVAAAQSPATPTGAVLLEGPRVVREAVLAGVELELLVLREDVRFEAPAEREAILKARGQGGH